MRNALSLWRGTAYADVATTQVAGVESVRLEELRVELWEDCLEAELACGRHRRVLGELQAAVASFPLRERLRAHLMTALYRSGRQPEALASYQEYRSLLAEEMGLDPSRELDQLHSAILNRAEALGVPS
jgi:DNA-binding SARP family transcriptional activator